MNRLALGFTLFALSCTIGGANPTWGGKPVPSGCPATDGVKVFPGGSSSDVYFCKPTDSSWVNDYVSRTERDVADSHGNPMLEVEFTQKSEHWWLIAGYRKYKNGSSVSYSQTIQSGDLGKIYDWPDWDVLDSHETLRMDCYDLGERNGLAKFKSGGNHVYFKIRYGGDLEYAYVVTFCGKEACDADEVGYGILNHVYFPALAACPHPR